MNRRVLAAMLASFVGSLGFGLFAQNTNSSNGKAPPTELTFRVDLRRLVPTTLTIEEGKYRILISSGVYVVPLSFSLNLAQTAEKVAGAKGSDRGRNVKLEADLHPGSYVLTVTGHPELISAITVTPKGGGK